MKIEYTEFSAVGSVRKVNQDSIFSAAEDDCGLFAVADGMGGHIGGEIAGQRLTEALNEWWNGFVPENLAFEKCCDELRSVICRVHKSIYDDYTAKGTVCGTTVALLFIYSDRYIVMNSGDSRVYSRKFFGIKQESADHVFGTESLISGELDPNEIKKHPDKNKLTAAVGGKKELKLYIASAPLKTREFFLCSDGVYKNCRKRDIFAAMCRKDVIKFVSDMIEKKGSPDNYSFIRIRLKSVSGKKSKGV